MADEEKRLPESEITDVFDDFSEEDLAKPAEDPVKIDDFAAEIATESEEPAEEDGIADRRVKEFKLDLGNKLDKIPEYTLNDESAEEIRRKRRREGFLKIMGGLIIVGISALLSMLIIFVSQDAFGFGKPDRAITVEIPQAAGLTEVAEILEEKGVINSGLLFRVFYKVTKPSGSFYYGTYALNSKWSYNEILEELFKYGTLREEVKVTFPEGFTVYQMAQRLEANGVCTADAFIDAVNNVEYDFAFLEDLSDDPMKYHKLEGFLFPDTYFFFKDDNPVEVVKKLLKNYEKKMTPKYLERMNELGFTQEDLIRLASIVQREAGKSGESERVASVYHNRLNNPGTYPLLQADPTRGYARELKEQMGDNVNEDILDAYDTYKSGGLPPGAICNPGMTAIKAVLYPADTDYYFFCSNLKTGKFYYATNYEDHQANLRKAGLV